MCSRVVALSDWFPHEDYCEGLADWREVTFMRKFRSFASGQSAAGEGPTRRLFFSFFFLLSSSCFCGE